MTSFRSAALAGCAALACLTVAGGSHANPRSGSYQAGSIEHRSVILQLIADRDDEDRDSCRRQRHHHRDGGGSREDRDED